MSIGLKEHQPQRIEIAMIHPKIPKRFNLTGVTHNRGEDNTQHNIDVLTLGGVEPFELEREPNNPYDPNAIRVHYEGFHIGYIPASCSVHLAPLMDAGRIFETCNPIRQENPQHRTLGISVEIREVAL